MLLVSGATATFRPQIQERPDLFGTLVVPRDGNALPAFGKWAGDNGAYTGFDPTAFVAMLLRHRWAKERCLWVAAPDVVGDAVGTARLFDEWEPRIREMGYPVAIVAQNGATASTIPWARIDCVFIGGALECILCGFVLRTKPPTDRVPTCPKCERELTEWKLGAQAAHIIQRANYYGKWAHMGRVNTKKRIRQAAVTGCDSVDGSGFSKWPEAMLARHVDLLRALACQRRLVIDELASTPTPAEEE